MLDLSQLTVLASISVREALDLLNRTAEGVLLLVDERGRLRRTVTDGDLRRLLLAGHGLEASLAALPEQTSITVGEGTSAAHALALMNDRVIDHLPVVDADGRPLELMLRRELDRQIHL
jgi:CBS domain-containing protein